MISFWKIALPIMFITAAVLAAAAMFAARPQPKHSPPEPPTLLVEVAEIERQSVVHRIASQGTIAPRTETTLVAEAEGQIIEVSPAFVSGGFFSKGDVLVRIDPRNYASAVKRARANVARASTQLETESALAGYAEKDYERLRRVNPQQGPASSLALRKPQMEQAMAELQSAEADLEKAEGDLDRTVIRAPYDGLVREKIADVGQYVSKGNQLARTFAIDRAEVRLPVTQQDLRYMQLDRLRRGEFIPVRLSADIGGERVSWAGDIVRSEGVVDPASRVLYLVAHIADPYDIARTGRAPLLMGTFVTAEIEGDSAGELVLVPRHALQRGNTLWVVDEQAKIHPREVNIVRRDEAFVYIESGVEVGERYCVTPIDQPLPGMKVRFDG